ncbi:MAG: T9SS type A sorting domain-containing protein [Bacteroidales bacterium]|jgi:hypothetical protein
MKKLFTFAMMFVICAMFMNAQTVVFEDDFESYDDGTALSTLGFAIWEGSAPVSDFDVDGIAAYSGTKFVNVAGVANKTTYVRKTVPATSGKSYTITIATQAPAAKLHKIGYKFTSTVAVLTAGTTNTSWQVQTVELTATTTEDLTFWVNFSGAGNVYIDNFKIVDNSTTAVNELHNVSFTVTRTAAPDLFSISNPELIDNYKVFDIKGQLICQSSDASGQINLSGSPDGIYVLKVQDVNGIQQALKLIKN